MNRVTRQPVGRVLKADMAHDSVLVEVHLLGVTEAVRVPNSQVLSVREDEYAEGAATVILACVDEKAGTYYMDDQDRPRAASPECSATDALVGELGALGLNIR